MRADSLKTLYRKLVDIGEACDALSRQYPGKRFTMAARDLATGIENGIKELSPATLKAISTR